MDIGVTSADGHEGTGHARRIFLPAGIEGSATIIGLLVASESISTLTEFLVLDDLLTV